MGRFMRIDLAKLKKVLEGNPDRLPYLVAHEVEPQFNFPPDFKIENFRGLFYCQQIVDANGANTRVISCWANQANFLMHRNKFLTAIRAHGRAAEWGGLHRELKTEKVSTFKKISVMSAVLAVTTLLGAYGTFRNQYEEWFAQPETALFANSFEDEINLPIAARENVQFTIKNVSKWSPASVQFTKFEVLDAGRKTATDVSVVGAVNTNFPSLAIGASQDILIPLKASRKGDYVLGIETSTKAGEFIPLKSQRRELKLHIWPNREFLPAQNIRPLGTKCIVDFPLSNGIPYAQGLACEALLTRMRGVVFRSASPSDGDPIMDSSPHPGNEVAVISWKTKGLSPMENPTMSLFLESDTNIPASTWTNIVQQIHLSFQ
jgi:hypothetical protein